MEVELHLALMPAAVEAVIVDQEGSARSKGDDQAVAAGGFGDAVRSEKIRRPELSKVGSQLIPLDG